ncbi:lysylphosphatidylglycerol synthase transmembrane domain-containing protein [Raoultibacter phocaeensis]|uniref:lysylphosphatidylglycerol synthase transmembrane domain-containing protein n=1 Tax=Raoultibacter phocaeensis TaxID=2479841 RepID=UPI00111B9D62|nr:lysylphosphatidylglycerol synthase transmembrane domain-containing protein [Raoultibacter phocaeensis]
MKKALLLVLGIVTCCVLIANADYLAEFLKTLQTGALVPIAVSIVLMLGRHIVQALSYDAAFAAVGFKTGLWHNIVLIFSLVFINTFCLFSGATGVAFIIDDAHRKGADAGTATSGAILSQIGYFAAVLVISVIGFITMLVSGTMNTLFLVGGLLLAGVLLILSSMFVVGYRKPRVLFRVFLIVEKLINRVLGLVKKRMKPGWGRRTASSFIDSAGILAHNPVGTLVTVGYASFSAVLNMACLVAIGYAFGFEHVSALVAAFAVAAISVILSPTPQGVGVVEAAIAAILTAHGCSLATATAIALVYRGIMFWIPFCIGALLLSQSGFFADKKNATEQQRAKDIGWISGTLVGLVGLVNIGLSLIPTTFEPYSALTSWIDMGAFLKGPWLIACGIVLLVLAVGLVMRFRTAWALAVTVLILIAGGEFLFVDTAKVALAVVVLVVWLFWKRAAFDKPLALPRRAGRAKITPVRTGSDGAQVDQGRSGAENGAGEPSWQEKAESGARIIQQAHDEGSLATASSGGFDSLFPQGAVSRRRAAKRIERERVQQNKNKGSADGIDALPRDRMAKQREPVRGQAERDARTERLRRRSINKMKRPHQGEGDDKEDFR